MKTDSKETTIGTVQDHGLSQTEAGTHYFFIAWRTDDGRDIESKHWLTEAAMEYSIRTARIIGLRGNDITALEPGCENSQDLRGARAKLIIKDEIWKGKTYKKVVWVDRIGGGSRIDKDTLVKIRESARVALSTKDEEDPIKESADLEEDEDEDEEIPF